VDDAGPQIRETESVADLQEILDALDQRILDALAAKATGETIVRLAEARAWLTNPDQPHGGGLTA
jgi:hypothetical protein